MTANDSDGVLLRKFIVMRMRSEDNGNKVEKRGRIIKRMSETERREVNDRANSSVTTRNSAYEARFLLRTK